MSSSPLANCCQGTYHGHEGLRALFTSFDDTFTDFQFEVKRFLARGDRVLADLRLTGRGGESGIPFEYEVFHLWELRDGLLAANDGVSR